MRPVAVRILHPDPGTSAGPIERWVAASRAIVAERHRMGFAAAGADDVRVLVGPPDDTPFGHRLRDLVRAERPAGLVILGSGSIPLATTQDRREFVEVAGSDDRRALANNRYSADIVAIAHASDVLADLPDLPGDNALPRWLEEVAGSTVHDLRRRWRLAIDIDGPLDVVLIDGHDVAENAGAAGVDLAPVSGAIDASVARPRTRGPSCWSPGGPRRPRWRGSNDTPRRGRGRSSRSAACGRACPDNGHRRPSSGRSWTATGRSRSATTWSDSPTRPSSTAGCCSPTGSERTRRPGRPPWTASRRTSCSRSGSRTRGCDH